MRILINFFIMIFLVFIQSTVMELFKINGVKPDLPLVFAICVALLKGENLGAFMGFINGFLEDIMYSNFLGFNSLVKFLTGFLSGYFTQDLYKGPAVITMGLTFLCSVVYHMIFIIISIFLKALDNPWSSFAPTVLPSALFNMIISPVVYHLLIKIEKFFDYYFDVKY